jgi:hypothetical protein
MSARSGAKQQSARPNGSQILRALSPEGAAFGEEDQDDNTNTAIPDREKAE